MNLPLAISKAENQDAEQMTALINSAYRGESSKLGWTTEADLLFGSRTDVAEILSLIANEDSLFLLCKIEMKLVGSVHLQKQSNQVYLGMLAVTPLLQGNGLGKALLFAAEQFATKSWSVTKSVMTVISCRHELIAFYERCGYLRTGISKVFPVNPELWKPHVTNLRLELLEKIL